MAKKAQNLLPALQRALRTIGENIRLARLRRRISTTLLSQRAGMTRVTYRKIENGDPSCTLGAYATVLKCLGLESDLALIGKDDILGKKLQDAKLSSPKERTPKKKPLPKAPRKESRE